MPGRSYLSSRCNQKRPDAGQAPLHGVPPLPGETHIPDEHPPHAQNTLPDEHPPHAQNTLPDEHPPHAQNTSRTSSRRTHKTHPGRAPAARRSHIQEEHPSHAKLTTHGRARVHVCHNQPRQSRSRSAEGWLFRLCPLPNSHVNKGQALTHALPGALPESKDENALTPGGRQSESSPASRRSPTPWKGTRSRVP